MSIEMMPVHLTGNDDGGPMVGTTPPRRLQRQPKPDSQLTDLAAVQLLNSGRLTKRDMRVIQTVWMFSIMTTDQIRRLLFYNYAKPRNARVKAERRLRLLYNEYCLDRVFRGLGHEFIYQLDVQGARIIQMQQQKQSRRDIKWSPKSVGEKLLQLDHYLSVTEFGVRLAEAARAHDADLQWLGENVLNLTKPDGTYFEPDGAGLLQTGEASLAFWFEWDMGTETLGVLRNKLRNYIEFLRHPDGWRGFFRRYPVLLLATTTQGRVEKILDDAKQLLVAHQVKPGEFVVLLTTHEALDQHGHLGPAWYRVGSTQPLHLAWGQGYALLDMARTLSKPKPGGDVTQNRRGFRAPFWDCPG